METIRLKSHVNSDGSLELKLNNLPANQDIEILLIYQSIALNNNAEASENQEPLTDLLSGSPDLVEGSAEILQQEINNTPKTTYEKFVESGLIGCVEIEEDLSTNYKQVLAQELAQKYDHR